MTNKQPSLLKTKPVKLDIKSPVFKPRPGWGGQLYGWFNKSTGGSGLMFAGMAVALLLSTWFIDGRLNERGSPDASLTGGEAAVSTISISVTGGKGFIHAAREAIGKYIDEAGITLTPEQRIFTENYLNTKMAGTVVTSGQPVDFSLEDLRVAVGQAIAASPATLAKLSQYANKVKFGD